MVNNQEIIEVAHQVFADEIAGLNQVQAQIGDEFCHAVKLILQCTGKVIVSGMGKSGHVGNKIAATLASTGTSAFFMHPAEALHGDLGMIDDNDLLIAISFSGESDELSSILPLVKKRSIPVIAMTGAPQSTLAKLSTVTLSILIDKEACPLNLAPTTSTTATLVLGDALAVALLSIKKFQPKDFALSHPGGSLGRKLLTTVADIMHSGDRLPKVVSGTSLKQVVVEISAKGLGVVGVVDANDKLVGVITDGDLRRAFDKDVEMSSLVADDVMGKNPLTMSIDAMAVDAVKIMNEKSISSFLVTDANGVLVGAFNLHDLFKAKLI
ncbi:MAG: KpsF/GutQ family sugar-phosphate isomerase [Neisseriaceae bacterium]|nr:MAG: KpsF/GutQ family sugar-phosphate isomerase [Neisseriaceae bacterium]